MPWWAWLLIVFAALVVGGVIGVMWIAISFGKGLNW